MSHPSFLDMEAARRALALRDPEAGADDIQRALAWVNRSEVNRRAFDRAQEFLAACEDVDVHTTPGAFDWMAPPAGKPRWRTPLAMAACVALLVLGGVLISPFSLERSRDGTPLSMRYASDRAELRTIVLPDGSVINLSPASTVSVNFSGEARGVELVDGEALFDVASDAARPFMVRAGNGTARALGTSFNIRRQGDGAVVTVMHGRVLVETAGLNNRAEATLGRAMQVSYSADGTMSPVDPADLDAALAWRRGVLIFSDRPLAEAVAEIQRYTVEPIIIEDAQIGSARVSATVHVNNITEWLNGLEPLLGISVVRSEEGILLVDDSRNGRALTSSK